MTVMIEILDVHLARPVTDIFNERGRDLVASLGHELKGRLDAKRVIYIHQLAAKALPSLGFDVVSHHNAAPGTIGPEPDERNSVNTLGLHGTQQQLFTQVLNGRVHGPVGKGMVSPSVQTSLLDVLADIDVHPWAHDVICTP